MGAHGDQSAIKDKDKRIRKGKGGNVGHTTDREIVVVGPKGGGEDDTTVDGEGCGRGRRSGNTTMSKGARTGRKTRGGIDAQASLQQIRQRGSKG